MQVNQESREQKPRTSKRGVKIGLSILAAVAVIAGGGLFYANQLQAASEDKSAAAPARPPMPVETVEVKIAESATELKAVGTLQSNESVVMMAEIPGRIARIGFQEGEQAPKGQLLFKLDSSVLKAEYDRAEANRALSEENFQRAEALYKVQSISELERDEAYARWQLDEATTRLAAAQLDKTVLKTPFAGTLGLRTVSVGDYIQPGQALVNLEDLQQLKVDFSVPEKYAAQVAVGQSFSLTTDAYAGQRFSGVIDAINPQIDVKSRSLTIRGKLENQEGLLRPGLFARVALVLDTKADALFIPEQALIPQPATQLVFKVVDGKAEMVPVQTGQRIKGWVEVTNGLVAGDVVVTGGHQKIGPGSPVHAMPADPKLLAKL